MVKPADKWLLLSYIRNKVVGQADTLIRGNPEQATLEELVGHLKLAFSDQLSLNHVFSELNEV